MRSGLSSGRVVSGAPHTCLSAYTPYSHVDEERGQFSFETKCCREWSFPAV